jgi:uncharacterized repeat protein (TIGR01451 family)
MLNNAKRILLALFLLTSSAHAQWVSLPDTNFRNFLQINYPSCMSGGMLDTTCSAVVNAIKVNCAFKNIYNLSGIQYFDNLDTLLCRGNRITTLPTLPPLIRKLDCSNNNYLTTISNLPASLTYLDCSDNYANLTSIVNLPPNLIHLYCSNNAHLSALPSLPSSLIELRCYLDSLTILPPLPSLLQQLWCSNNHLSSLPALAGALTYLDCSTNNLTALPALPASLQTFACSNNHINYIGTLPASLMYFYCSYNLLSSLPNSLPATLIRLECDHNSLNGLPALPSSLQDLYCDYNNMYGLPILPNTLQTLSCSHNYIYELTQSWAPLPSSLSQVICDYNQLQVIPTIYMDYMWILSCKGNQIYTIDAQGWGLNTEVYLDSNQLTSIPNYLTSARILSCNYNLISSFGTYANFYGCNEFYCAHNLLTALPALPNYHTTNIARWDFSNNQIADISNIEWMPDSIRYFNISNNPITCLPPIRKIDTLIWNNTNIQCLPNYGQIFHPNPSIASLPLCQLSNNCPAIWNIIGNVYFDNNSNCIQDANDTSLLNIPVRLMQGSVLLQEALTDIYGRFSFRTGLGTYQVKVDTTNAPYTVLCPPAFYETSTLVVSDTLDTLASFGLRCSSNFDLISRSISPIDVFRPGAIRNLYLNAGDAMTFSGISCAAVNGTVQAILNGPCHYYSPLGIPPTSVSGDTITWAVSNFSTIHPMTDFNVKVYVDTLATSANTICITLNVSPTDIFPSNNTRTSCYPIVNSYDPNEKYMEPTGIVDTSNYWFTFTVFFQNTGNAPAENIYILDTLDADLDLSTFTYLSSSHNVITQLLPGRVLRFNYPNINLPDSTTDETNSHGYVQYKIKRKPGLPLNTVISNKAYIYFDFNPAVVTNSVSATLTTTVGIQQAHNSEFDFEIYPNPSKGTFEILGLKSEVNLLNIYNLVGVKVYSQTISGKQQTVKCKLSAGVYFIKVASGDAVDVKRLILE